MLTSRFSETNHRTDCTLVVRHCVALRQGKSDAPIGDFDDWKNYVLSEHAEMEGLQPLPSRLCSPPDACFDDRSSEGNNRCERKRMRDEADADPSVDTGDDSPGDTLHQIRFALHQRSDPGEPTINALSMPSLSTSFATSTSSSPVSPVLM